MPANVAVVGVGAMGGGIARALLRSDSTATVSGYDRSPSLVREFHDEARAAGKARPASSSSSSSLPSSSGEAPPPTSLGEAVTDRTDAAVLVLVNEGQCEEVCFGGDGGEEGSSDSNLLGLLSGGSCVILCSTVTATWARTAAERFASRGVLFVDCPVSGGPARALDGDLTLMASGSDASVSAVAPLLGAMARDGQVHVLPGGAGAGSAAKMVHQLLAGVHVVAAAEALALAAKAGIDVRRMSDVVRGAAGMSWMFGDRGARMTGEVRPPRPVRSAADVFVKDLGIVRGEAGGMGCPVPLAAAALQQFVAAARGLGLGREDDSMVVRAYEAITGVPVGGSGSAPSTPSTAAAEAKAEAEAAAAAAAAKDGGAGGKPLDVCVVGIGAMGGGIARSFLRSERTNMVVGYDRAEGLAESFLGEAREAGKAPPAADAPPASLGEAVTDRTDAVVLVLVNERQCEEVCFGKNGENLMSLMKPGACVVLCSTVTATWAKRAAEAFAAKGVLFVDCPISGGPARAETGELTMMASGDGPSLAAAMPLLNAAGKDVHVIPGGPGFGSKAKMVHQLLAGVHVVAAAEALALAAKAGIDPRRMYGIVNGAAGASWMFADRGGRMIRPDEPENVLSAVDIFVKDLDIVLSEATEAGCPVPLAAAALQQFVGARGLGLGRRDDSQVKRVYEQITGVPIGKQV